MVNVNPIESHEARPFGRGPTTRSLGDLLTIIINLHLVAAMIHQVVGLSDRFSARNSSNRTYGPGSPLVRVIFFQHLLRCAKREGEEKNVHRIPLDWYIYIYLLLYILYILYIYACIMVFKHFCCTL